MPHGSDYYLKIAKKAGCPMKPAKGDHTKVYAPVGSRYQGEHVSIPYRRELATGTEHHIRSFFIKIGLLSLLVAALILAL